MRVSFSELYLPEPVSNVKHRKSTAGMKEFDHHPGMIGGFPKKFVRLQ
jgi:hypothetical protein